MIILDTDVLSELIKNEPERRVQGWVSARPAALLFTTAISQAEVLYGVALLPDGRRREALAIAVDAMFEEDFRGRILAFDTPAARAFAEIAVSRRRADRPIAQFDAQIAAIARATGATLATHNVADFVDCGIAIVDPWRD